MTKRLFFLIPDLKETSTIAHELEARGVEDANIHVCGGLAEDVEDEHLHPANVLQMTHLGQALKRGPWIGLLFVVFILGLFLIDLPAKANISVLGYASMLLFGIVIGVWASGMIGISVKDEVVEKYEGYVEQGHFIMMVDIAPDKENDLMQVVMSHHPNARMVEPEAVH
jgi:hypothetical protein